MIPVFTEHDKFWLCFHSTQFDQKQLYNHPLGFNLCWEEAWAPDLLWDLATQGWCDWSRGWRTDGQGESWAHGNGGAESTGFLSPPDPKGGSTSTLHLPTCNCFVTVHASSGPQANWKSPRFSQDLTLRHRKQRPCVDTQEPLHLLSGWEEYLLDVCPSPAASDKVFSMHTAFSRSTPLAPSSSKCCWTQR